MTSYPFISVQEQENLSPSALLLFLESFLITKATVTPYSLTTYSLSEMCLLKISWACVVLNPGYPPDGCFTEVAASSRVDVKSCRACEPVSQSGSQAASVACYVWRTDGSSHYLSFLRRNNVHNSLPQTFDLRANNNSSQPFFYL